MSLDRPYRSESAVRTLHPARSWAGQMIAPLADKGQGTQASFVSQKFSVDAVPAAVMLHITAQGFTGLL